MSLDLELESWRREWALDTEPLPELKRRLRGQNRRLIAGGILIACCLAFATVMVVRHPTAGWAGFAAGIWASTLAAGGYALWLRRGTWEPASQTTRAYAELLHRRAIATLRKTVVLRRTLLALLIPYGAFVIWNGHGRLTRGALVAAGLAIEVVWMRALEGRRRRALEAAARLVEDGAETAESHSSERTEFE